MFPSTFAHAGMAGEGKSHHNSLDADRLFHVKIAGASADSAPLLVVQTSPAWEQGCHEKFDNLEEDLSWNEHKIANPLI